MADREITDKLSSGEIAEIKLGGVTADDKLLTSSEIDAKILVAIAPAAVSIATGVMAAQTLVAATPEKLEWMGTAIVDAGASDISYTLIDDKFTINTTAIYKTSGVLSFVAPINDVIEVELYINGSPTGFESSAIGRGTGSVLTLSYAFMNEFTAADYIELYVTSTGTSITIQSANISIEKTEY